VVVVQAVILASVRDFERLLPFFRHGPLRKHVYTVRFVCSSFTHSTLSLIP